MKLHSKDIEIRAQKIRDEIAEFHEDLIQCDQTAWILDIPGIEVSVEPNTNDVTIRIKIGKSYYA